MSSEWVKFTDVLEAIIDNRGRTCPVSDFGLPLIATNCVNGTSLYPTYQTNRYVSEETYKNWFRGHPKPDDILFVCKGSPGRTNWVPDPVDFCIAQDMVAVRADPTKIYPKFLFAALRSKIVQDQINNMHVGTMIPHFKKGDFDKLLIPNIEMQKQIEIGDLYFSFSKRIELLRETNQTLEAVAQALFKSWFVDFDPVRAKADGKLPDGIDAETAELFPDKFDESSIGVIPTGWSQEKISSLCDVVTRGVTPVYEVGSNIFVINQKVNRGAELDLDSLKELSPNLKIPSEKMAHKWDLLINCLGEGTLGRVHLFKGNSNIYAVDQHMSICRGAPSVNVFLTQVLSSAAGQKNIQDLKTGSTGMTMLNVSKLRDFLVLWPGTQLVDKFFEVVEKLFEQVANNDAQTNTLQHIRDTLLPRLISGQLRIADAEAELEKAVA